jgi:hypothetical protein
MRFKQIIATFLLMGFLSQLPGCSLFEPAKPLNDDPPPEQIRLMVGKSARLYARGKPPLKFKAPDKGSVSVIDEDLNKLVAFGFIAAEGVELTIDAKARSITLRDPAQPKMVIQLVGEGQIDETHSFGVYFVGGVGMERQFR